MALLQPGAQQAVLGEMNVVGVFCQVAEVPLRLPGCQQDRHPNRRLHQPSQTSIYLDDADF
jgi:hypothetical protein